MEQSATDPPNYGTFTTRDFVADAFFRRWVLAPDDGSMDFWTTYRLRHPAQQTAMDEATALVLHLRMNYDDLTNSSQQRIWQTLSQQFDSQSRQPAVHRPLWQRPGRWPVAASLAGMLLTAGSIWYSQQPHRQVVRAGYGQTLSVTLPDSSVVLLNGNSSLTYVDKWPAGRPREVWLNGEAFFRVTKRVVPGGKLKFVTHTPNLDITVLGTQFTVNTRRGNTAVMLLEGRVTLTKPGQSASRVLVMKPGELASASAEIERVEVRAEKALSHVAWVQHQFVFEGTPLRDIARQLLDTDGLELVFEDNALADRRFTANLSSQNVETLLTTLTATFNLATERIGNRVYLRRLTN